MNLPITVKMTAITAESEEAIRRLSVTGFRKNRLWNAAQQAMNLASELLFYRAVKTLILRMKGLSI